MKKILTILIIILLIVGGILAYWYFFLGGKQYVNEYMSEEGGSGFNPFDRSTGGTGEGFSTTTTDTTPTSTPTRQTKIPALRLLSSTPVGGYGASTTATTTFIRWVDRGRGNIYEAQSDTLDIKTVSNTIVPMIYTSAWNKNLTSFIGSMFDKNTDYMPAIYADITKRPSALASSTKTDTLTEYELKGKNLPKNTIGFAVSPKKDQLFLLVKEGEGSVGYVSSFDGKNAVKIFETPLTQINVDWPSDKVIAITTKASANISGYLYFVDPKTGTWKKIVGPLLGLTAKVSRDGERAFISAVGNNNTIQSIIYNIKDNRSSDAVIRTLADKCTWGNYYKEMVYCATPSKIDPGTYPDDWYLGTKSFVDKIWQVDTESGEAHLLSQIINESDRVIDIFNMDVDNKDNYLIFMNKNDLSLWSLDLMSI